jgi:hypothetical protein
MNRSESKGLEKIYKNQENIYLDLILLILNQEAIDFH